MLIKELLREAEESWYVLDVPARTILVSDVSKAEAKKQAEKLGKTAWRLEDGTFWNEAGDVSYNSTRGWEDKS